jgi:hypothetical protein
MKCCLTELAGHTIHNVRQRLSPHVMEQSDGSRGRGPNTALVGRFWVPVVSRELLNNE